MSTNPPMDPTPPTRMSLEEPERVEKTPKRGLIRGNRTGEVKRQRGFRISEKESLGSKAKDWLWKEVLWIPKSKSHGEEEVEGEGGREMMMDRHSLEIWKRNGRGKGLGGDGGSSPNRLIPLPLLAHRLSHHHRQPSGPATSPLANPNAPPSPFLTPPRPSGVSGGPVVSPYLTDN